jgi:two-component system OmpR family sensor kinase
MSWADRPTLRSLLRRPAALRRRVVLSVLALLAVLLVGLFAAVDVVLQARLRSDLRTRLDDRVALAEQLDGALSPQQLVDRLKGSGVTAQLCSAASVSSSSSRCLTGTLTVARPGPQSAQPGHGGTVGTPARGPNGGPAAAPGAAAPGTRPPGRAQAAPKVKPPIRHDGPVLFVRTTLPQSGQVLTLAVDTSQVTSTVRRLIVLEAIGGLLALGLAALLMGRVVAVALRPLDDMTSLARRIAAGDRGRRLGTGRPDTELGRTATAFDAMLDELETALSAAAAAQTQLRGFLSDISHELRTPLTGLHATSELLLREEPDAAGRERAYLAMVRETRRAGRLVDDLVTAARFDTDAPLAVESSDLVEVVRHEIERAQLVAPGQRIGLRGPSSAPVVGDPMRLGQIVANLLDNARHASPAQGEVTAEIHAVMSAPPGRRPELTWQLDVADTGPGVPEPDRERIFDRLVRLDVSRSRHTGGFGLGLPIARALARAHGGDLTYVGRPTDSGARFRLTLPSRAAVAPGA